MADKEERIVIIQWNINYDICPAPTEYQCGTSKSCDDCKVGMSRQEAIKKMAKALRKKLFKNEVPTQKIKEQGLEKAYYEYVDFCCTAIAEFELDALLGGKK